MRNPLGLILYQGPSQLPRGGPIVVIATLNKSENRKTGDMIQTYILRSDMDPTEAINKGLDRSVCGDCPHRAPTGKGHKGRSCYVNMGQSPLGVYRAFKRGRYVKYNRLLHYQYVRNRNVRYGAYGDSAAAPFEIYRSLFLDPGKTCGYTQQWRDCDPRFAEICMASVTSLEEKIEANEKGWRTFRVKKAENPRSPNEIYCLASHQWPTKSTCSTCGMCDGNSGKTNRLDIVIDVHGAGKGNFKLLEKQK